jgi:hypothetical protein
MKQTLLPKTTNAGFTTLFTLSTRCNLPMHHLALMTDVGFYSQLCPCLCSLRKYNLRLERQVSGYTKQRQANFQKYTQMNRKEGNKIATHDNTILLITIEHNLRLCTSHSSVIDNVPRGTSRCINNSDCVNHAIYRCDKNKSFYSLQCCDDKHDLLKYTKYNNFNYISDQLKTIYQERYCETGILIISRN